MSDPRRDPAAAAPASTTPASLASAAVAVFTRDLRLHDNPVLAAAAAGAGRVVPLFVLDDAIVTNPATAPARLRFLYEALADLDASLRSRGSRLILRRGKFAEEVCRIAEEAGAADVHIAGDVSGFAAARQTALADALAARGGRRLHVHAQVHTVQEPGDLIPAGRDHFAVFTPYLRRWSEAPLRAPAKVPTRLQGPPDQLASQPLPDVDRTVRSVFPGGEAPGRRRAGKWLSGLVDGYADAHDDLAGDATSRLSPYLHFGCVCATELLRRSADQSPSSPGRAAFVRQLAWRDFHHQVLAARPDVVRADYRPRGDAWQDDPAAFEAWAEGRTGIPIVDAGMRQLSAEGWMHNRARMITASFLTKTLYLDWRRGAAHFFFHLVDGDVANNVLNWQWVAGTGTDTRPNRVLNPLRQAERYDPTGAYVRRYVPELADIEAVRDVHEPWRLGDQELRRRGYPPPMVDLGAARSRFLMYREQGNVPLFEV